MDNIKIWKDGERLIIIIENCNATTEDLILNMVQTGISNQHTGLKSYTENAISPTLHTAIYVDKACKQPGMFLYVPEGKVYLNNIRNLPNEADIIIKSLNETTSHYPPGIDAFAKRLKELMTQIIHNQPLNEVICRYKDYFNGILQPIYCENMCNSLEELQAKTTEEELKNIILARL